MKKEGCLLYIKLENLGSSSYPVFSEAIQQRFSSKSWPTAKDGLTNETSFCEMELCMDGNYSRLEES